MTRGRPGSFQKSLFVKWYKGTGFLSRRKFINKKLNKCKKGGSPYLSPCTFTKKRQALLYWLVFIYSWKDGYPRLPPLPPRFDSALRLRVDKFSSLFFKKRAILSSKVSFGLKFPFERTSLERSPWRVGRLE